MYEEDIEKLRVFETASAKTVEMTFGWVPNSDETLPESKHIYKLTPDHLNVFMVIGKPESNAFHKPLDFGISNFVLLHGFINLSEQCHSFLSRPT